MEWRVCGFISPEIRDNGRVGFSLISIHDGWKGVLANVKTSSIEPSEAKLGKYVVNVRDIEECVGRVVASLDECDLLVVDEIGKMEMLSKKFRDFVEDVVIEGDIDVFATVHRSLVNKFDMGIMIRVDEVERVVREVISLLMSE
jgi:nucleoside-triphosphatase